MNSRLTPPKVLFEELFGQLRRRVAEREELKEAKGLSSELVDVTDQLHDLRAQIAAARCTLAEETGTHICARPPAGQEDAAKSISRSVQSAGISTY